MLLILLAYLGGVLTILSPCILPVLPFVFARAGQPFVRSGLPMLLGMAITFALVATLAAVGGGWAVQANQYGRLIAILLLGFFGLTLLLPRLADRLMQPLVALGGRLSQSADAAGGGASILPSLVLGMATGLLWAPCAGPILGLVLTGAALQGANGKTTLLLVAYGLGAATSLAAALLIGGKLFAALKRSLGTGEWIRRGLGAAVLVGVIAIAFGWDTGVLTRLSLASTAGFEQKIVDQLHPEGSQANPAPDADILVDGGAMNGGGMMMAADPDHTGGGMMMAAPGNGAAAGPPIEGRLPSLAGAVAWLNSPPLSVDSLRGKVVLIDFWTYSCINCLRTLPYVRAWADKYRDQGLVVIGVHAPEFAFEKDLDNVRRATKDLKVGYPVAIDNDYAIWRGFGNRFWPAHYFIDTEGRIRHHHFGEGGYDESEKMIQQLLAEAGKAAGDSGLVKVEAGGVAQAANDAAVKSPETYLGYSRAENFVSADAANSAVVRDEAKSYAIPGQLTLNQWALAGTWNIGKEQARLSGKAGRIAFRFHARDVNLVLGPGPSGKPVRYRVLLDGKPPAASHGVDSDAQGLGSVRTQQLYQLVRQAGAVEERTFEIEFLDPDVEAFAFTFG
ncbi:cytochrome c biogenesis protein DipZ [uncultured Nevskia sp.]|uniref:cytochrome c biogenesis protein DipZ n=1 Tax=uncultured Nevskia sp. TaxID=228950 RepID=UPI0025EABF12|nr:cytochrome c biogenesis protein DipZ [uncultured Nevskia sp.]